MTDPFLEAVEIAKQQEDSSKKSKVRPEEDPFTAALEIAKQQETITTAPPVDPMANSNVILPEDVEKIAKQRGVDPAELTKLSAYYSNVGVREPDNEGYQLGQALRGTAGKLGKAVGLSVPQYLYKEYVADEKMRSALDDIQKLSDTRESTGQTVSRTLSELGTGLATAGVLPITSTAAKLTTPIATGAIAGGAGATSDATEKGMLVGAGLGALPLVGAVAAKAVGAGSRVVGKLFGVAEKKADDVINTAASKTAQRDIDAGVEKLAEETKQSEAIIAREGLNRAKQLSDEEARVIVKQQWGDDKLSELTKGNTGAIRSAAEDIINERTIKFARDLTSDSNIKNVDEAVRSIKSFTKQGIGTQGGGHGEQNVANRYADFVAEELATKVLQKEGRVYTKQTGALGSVVDLLSDAPSVYRNADNIHGTKAYSTLSQLSRDFTKVGARIGESRAKLHEVDKLADKLGLGTEVRDSTKLFDAVDKGNFNSLSPNEKQLVTSVKKLIDDVRDQAVSGIEGRAPVNIAIRKDYLPHMTVPAPEMISRIVRKGEEVARVAGNLDQLSGKDLYKLASENTAVKELIDTSTTLLGRVPTSGRDLKVAIMELTDGSMRDSNKMELISNSIFRREDKIPEYLLEKNIFKLADRYASGLYRQLYTRDSLNKLRHLANVYEKAGDAYHAQYTRNLITDLTGVRSRTWTSLSNNMSARYNTLVDRMAEGKSPGTKEFLRTLKAAPSAFDWLSKRAHPNLLSTPHAVIQNSTQWYSKVAPELGGPEGYKITAEAIGKYFRNKSEYDQLTKRLGTVPEEWIEQGQKALGDGIRSSKILDMGNRSVQAIEKATMYAFQKAEEVNRGICFSVADKVTGLLESSDKAAIRMVNRMPLPVRRQVNSAMKSGDTEAARNAIAFHLNEVTQFSYNKVTMFQLGRTLGPLFSVFSKWPTATIGDITANLRIHGIREGALRNSEKYIVPLSLNILGDQAINKLTGSDEEDKSARQQALTGTKGIPGVSTGLTGASPIMSPLGLSAMTQPLAPTVAYKAVVKPLLRVAKGDLDMGEAAALGASEASTVFGPGAGAVKLFTEKLPTILYDEKPEGDTNLERSEEGIRMMQRRGTNLK